MLQSTVAEACSSKIKMCTARIRDTKTHLPDTHLMIVEPIFQIFQFRFVQRKTDLEDAAPVEIRRKRRLLRFEVVKRQSTSLRNATPAMKKAPSEL